MNAGIVTLRDGTPCIAYDELLPFPISYVEFCRADFQIKLVYDKPQNYLREGRKFEFPLDHPFVRLLEERRNVAVARIGSIDLVEIKVYPVVFTNS
ncbi:MAG: hypothetical protein PW788_15785 [Micavibrio sp.]|nr:hypothetical protein [Micavibrio sp.]